MRSGKIKTDDIDRLRLSDFPEPAKVLVTATILVMGIALLGALGQIIVHDIIPTFFSGNMPAGHTETQAFNEDSPKDSDMDAVSSGRGDLFSDLEVAEKEAEPKPFYKDEQFVWLLRWSHIHLFGMNMIFIFIGSIAVFLNLSGRARTWLVALPFIGVLVDIGAMWLKTYVSPVFFWLHVPGGGLFMTGYLIVSFRALTEMWANPALEN